MRAVINTLAISFLLFAVGVPLNANAIEQTYQLYSKNGDYYLKTDPTWVPISGDIFIIIPIYGEGEILKLTNNGGSWQVENIQLGDFSTANPILVSGGSVGYADLDSDGLTDISVNLGSAGQTLKLYSSTSGIFRMQEGIKRRVIYIHTDLLGSPAAETDEEGEVL